MRRVLELISRHDGQWSWYQLERVLAGEETLRSRKLLVILRELEAQGLISSIVVTGRMDPLYSITAKGASALDSDGEVAPIKIPSS